MLSLCRRCSRTVFHGSQRWYSTPSHIPPLPPTSEWRTMFASPAAASKDRVSVREPETARKIVESFLGEGSPAAGDGKIIIEAFPGPGALSRAMLEMPESKIRKLIILEDHPDYLPYLQSLEEADSRVKIVPLSGFGWDTYSQLEDTGLLQDVDIAPWESGIHPQLHFISHLQHTIKGEQLIAQLFRCIPDRAWLYKFGRIPMSFVLSEWVWQRINAQPPSTLRCKLSVIAEATAKATLSLNPKELLPYNDHFHPVTPKVISDRRPEARRPGHPMVAMNIVPHAEQFITPGMLDKWDYCLRRLFVLKSTPLKSAISSLAPGAQTLLKTLTDPSLSRDQQVDIKTRVRDLTIADWALILRAFDNWPFAPEDLMISDAFTRSNSQRIVL